MKVLITGATGNIGGEVLLQFLQHPSITSVVALSRRDIPSESLPNNNKFKNVIIKDFGHWSQDVMDIIQDADAMFWAMGTNDTSPGPNFDWPLAFQEAMLKAREGQTRTTRFRYVHLSGKWVVQDQEAWLLFLQKTRRLKGRAEIVCLEFAKEHTDTWQTFIIKPGGVVTPNMFGRGLWMMLLGTDWFIQSEQLSAYVAELITMGKEVEGLIYNKRMLEKGQALLQMTAERT
ncbi:uncharacterized protein BDR25DRAFT_369778 [Lindgomyces ingoldianus]|uniref:Uncharacterized protein n=1 Tax=Lindgomyces ingoldianus TaxID=673940 RepID=A0ACB6QVC3_9PLEO|nr:uncharacterized protein BDR25DRAFT_369778 [Lindgomyces ingoldianus]KAF2470528.1 hypothetical protein BDR25DRAFT_369778 [Lindgomyces ingoldianus]